MGATPQIVEKDIPSEMVAEATAKRLELVEAVANHDDELMELFIAEEEVPAATLSDGICRCATPLLHCTSQQCPVMESEIRQQTYVSDGIRSCAARNNVALPRYRSRIRTVICTQQTPYPHFVLVLLLPKAIQASYRVKSSPSGSSADKQTSSRW